MSDLPTEDMFERINLVSLCCEAPIEDCDMQIGRCSGCGEMSPIVEAVNE